VVRCSPALRNVRILRAGPRDIGNTIMWEHYGLQRRGGCSRYAYRIAQMKRTVAYEARACVTNRDVSSSVVCAHHATRNNTPIHNILSTAPQLSISQKALGTLPEDGNVMPKHVGATIHN
jgi:hypothetical protein